MEAEKIINEYIETFGKLPPRDMVFDYYDKNYLKLMQEAVKKHKEITPEFLEKYLENKPYDIDIPFDYEEDEEGDLDV